jgi:hypothetical protein
MGIDFLSFSISKLYQTYRLRPENGTRRKFFVTKHKKEVTTMYLRWHSFIKFSLKFIFEINFHLFLKV